MCEHIITKAPIVVETLTLRYTVLCKCLELLLISLFFEEITLLMQKYTAKYFKGLMIEAF